MTGCDKNDESQISDENFYEQIAYSVICCYSDMYNQNVAGKPVGGQNFSGSGPLGGTVTITGSTSEGDGMTVIDLDYSMTDVKYVKSSNDYTTVITITGVTAETGSFSSSYTSLNYQSENIHIVGKVTYGSKSRQIDMTGPMSFNRSANSVSGEVFGHVVSW